MNKTGGPPSVMQIDWDTPIRMDDGVVLRADIFRPTGAGKCPVILSYGPYAKGLSFQEGYKGNWARLIKAAPEVLNGSSTKLQNWELVDPEKWVPDGYVCVRVDSRGAGRSPGYLDVWSPREAQDLFQCIEWAGTQPWSNGKVGLNGISYYAINQWQVGALRPPHLAARCIWEGCSDFYRELCRHGGILRTSLRAGIGARSQLCSTELARAGRQAWSRASSWRGLTRFLRTSSRVTAPTFRARRRAADRTTITTRPGPPISHGLRRRYCRPAIGAAWACTRAAISKVFSVLVRSRNGLRCMGTHTSPISTVATGKACRSASSAISSRARIPAGTSSRLCRSTSGIPEKNSCCAARRSGRSRARNGRGIFCSRTDWGSRPRRPGTRRSSAMTRPARGSHSVHHR